MDAAIPRAPTLGLGGLLLAARSVHGFRTLQGGRKDRPLREAGAERFAETWEIVEYPGGPAPAEQTAFLNSLLERSP